MSNVEALPERAGPSGYEAILAIDQAVLDAIPAAVYVCAANGVLVRFNRRAVEFWGRAPRPGDPDERFCGSLRLYQSDGIPLSHVDTPMEAVLRTGKRAHDREVVIERNDGSRINVLVNIEPLWGEAGELQGAINCFQDITERKKSESAVRASERRLQETLDALPTAIYTTDAEGRITFLNRLAVDLGGRKPELGADEWWPSSSLENVRGEPLPEESGPMALALTQKRAIRGMEVVARRPDLYPRPLHALSDTPFR